MKILVISLQRLGDTIMASPVIAGLQEKYQNAKVDLLCESASEQVAKMIPGLNSIHYLDYKLVQSSLGELDRGIFEGLDRVDQLVTNMSLEKYDLIVNLTNNKMAGWLCALISAPKKMGLWLDETARPHFGNIWFKHLNDLGPDQHSEGFHQIDILLAGAGLKPGRRVKLVPSNPDNAEFESYTSDWEKYICIQPLTSDTKKNWDQKYWQEFLSYFKAMHSDYGVLVLAAPNEEAILTEMVNAARTSGSKIKIAPCSMETALNLIQRSDLLVTCDTSIKHLASATTTKVIELSLGSASVNRTGIYSDKCMIVQSLAACAPCTHSSTCPYVDHHCAQSIDPELVAALAHSYLEANEMEIRTLAFEYSDVVRIYKTDLCSLSYWTTVDLSQAFEKSSVMDYLELSTQRLDFELPRNLDFVESGTEGLGLSRVLMQAFPERDKQNWIVVLNDIEKDCVDYKSKIETLSTELRLMMRHLDEEVPSSRFEQKLDEIISDDRILRTFKRSSKLLIDLKNKINASSSTFNMMRQAREALESALRRVVVEQKIVKSVKNQMLEVV